MFEEIISGGITDVTSQEALNHAELYYAEIRKYSSDVEKIANNTAFSYEQILQVKQFLFLDKHKLDDGEPRYFDACFEIAQSWQRLMGDRDQIEPHDILLIQHEINEMELICKGLPQSEAHDLTNKLYNYTEASEAYYAGKQIAVSGCNQNSGGVRRKLTFTTH